MFPAAASTKVLPGIASRDDVDGPVVALLPDGWDRFDPEWHKAKSVEPNQLGSGSGVASVLSGSSGGAM